MTGDLDKVSQRCWGHTNGYRGPKSWWVSQEGGKDRAGTMEEIWKGDSVRRRKRRIILTAAVLHLGERWALGRSITLLGSGQIQNVSSLSCVQIRSGVLDVVNTVYRRNGDEPAGIRPQDDDEVAATPEQEWFRKLRTCW